MNLHFRPIFLVFILLCVADAARTQGIVIPGFTVADHACVNTPVTIRNTTTGATNYYWSFCAADFNSIPQATNLGNPGGKLGTPVFGSYQQDDDGNFYGLVSNYDPGYVVRLNFGNSLLNTPTAENLGNFGGAIPNELEGLQVIKANGNWTAILVGGGNETTNSSSRVVKLDFGNSLANTPVATNWGNIGPVNFPHDLFILNEGGIYYGLAVNVGDNTFTRLNFGPDFTNPPTGTNLGNIGSLDYPAGMTFVRYNGNLYAYVANRLSNSITRLDFGSSILNTPTGVSIPNPGGTLDYPRDISLFTTCDGVYGFVSNETSNDLIKLNFGSDPTNPSPQATNLGSAGNLSFPHSIAEFFQVGNDIYSFIHNASNSTLTRLRFAGCPDIPGSALADPPPVNYPNPGTYNINLLVDLGLPTQTSFCRSVTINPLPRGSLAGDTVCYGSPPALAFTAAEGTAPFDISYVINSGAASYTGAGLDGHSSFPLPVPLTDPGSTLFTLQTIQDANGCSTTSAADTRVLIRPLPQGGISGNTACADDSARVLFQASAGDGPFDVLLSNGAGTIGSGGTSSGGFIYLAPLPATSTFSLLAITDTNGCSRTSGFTSPAVTLTLHPSPKILFTTPDAVCADQAPFLLTAASETSGLAGSGSYRGDGIDAAGNFSPSLAGPGSHVLTYTFATDVCVDSATGVLVVNALPPAQPPMTIEICGGTPVQLGASGGVKYQWTPATGLNDPESATPIATVDTTTHFLVQVTNDKGCSISYSVEIDAPVNSKTPLVLPNAFTPNDDGHNDCFGIGRWGDVTVSAFEIFDRLGVRVFSTKNPSDCWDGTFKGQPQPSGGYVYVIKATSRCGPIVRTGLVMLVR